MDLLTYDIIGCIINELDLKSIMKLSQINKFFHKTVWTHKFMLQIKDIVSLPKFIEINKKPLDILFIYASDLGHSELIKFLIKNDVDVLTYRNYIINPSTAYQTKITKFLLSNDDTNNLLVRYSDLEILTLFDEGKLNMKYLLFNMKTYNFLLLEQYFNGTTNFDKTAVCEIASNGAIAQELYLKIVLPIFPDNIKLKKNFCCSLIKKIEIEIGGKSIIYYDSYLLEKIYKINKPDIKMNRNVIYYPINLRSIFGEWKFHDLNKSCTECDHKRICNMCQHEINLSNNYGINLFHLYHHNVRIYIKFGNLFDIIDMTESSVELLNKINNVELIDALFFVRFIYYPIDYFNSPYDKLNCHLLQNINYWLSENINLSLNEISNCTKIELGCIKNKCITKINQIVLFFKTSIYNDIDCYRLLITDNNNYRFRTFNLFEPERNLYSCRFKSIFMFEF